MELEKERASVHIDSIAEVDRLRTELSVAQKEAKIAKQCAAANRSGQNKMEVFQLNAEVKKLTDKLAQAEKEASLSESTRVEERNSLENQLKTSKSTVESLKQTVSMLEQRLADSKAAGMQLARSSPTHSAGRSVKRKIDDKFNEDEEIATRESVDAHERITLREELKKSRATEDKLKAEIEVMKDLLQCAEASANETKVEIEDEVRERRARQEELSEEVHELQRKLQAAESNVLQLSQAQAMDQRSREETLYELRNRQAKERKLLDDIDNLKKRLERAELDCQEERLRAEEERRISRETEAARLVELDQLRQEARAPTSSSSESALAARVRQLEFKLKMAEAEVVHTKKQATLETKTKDAETLDLRRELAVTRARLASAVPSESPENSRFTYVSGSGDSVSSFGIPDSPGRSHFSVSSRSTSSFTTPRLKTRGDDKGSPNRWASPIFEDLPDDEAADSSVQTSKSSPKRSMDLDSLKKRLQESNERLLNANIKLKGISKSTDGIAKGQSKMKDQCDDLRKLADRHSNGSRPSTPQTMMSSEAFTPISSSKEFVTTIRDSSIEDWREEMEI